VGTDCSVGKMYTALAMDRGDAGARGMKATFRATGQTGILITGDGVPLDAVIADFMAGSVEWLTPDNDDDHWDLIEGQGSLFHVSYSGVTLALIHGGQPDALILCHEPTRTHMRGLPDYALPTLETLRDTALPLARIANPACEVVGVSVNTQHMGEDEALATSKVEERMGLPATDPVPLQGPGAWWTRWRRSEPACGRPPAGVFGARRSGGAMRIDVTRRRVSPGEAFTISRGTRTEAKVLTVTVRSATAS
jgi:uncharacterized NAD-dependent epimerase/dehydratase family protein